MDGFAKAVRGARVIRGGIVVIRLAVPGMALRGMPDLTESGLDCRIATGIEPISLPPAGIETGLAVAMAENLSVCGVVRRKGLIVAIFRSLETVVCDNRWDSLWLGFVATNGMLNVLRGAGISDLIEFRFKVGTGGAVLWVDTVLFFVIFWPKDDFRGGVLGAVFVEMVAWDWMRLIVCEVWDCGPWIPGRETVPRNHIGIRAGDEDDVDGVFIEISGDVAILGVGVVLVAVWGTICGVESGVTGVDGVVRFIS
jgi:hypothetical protein